MTPANFLVESYLDAADWGSLRAMDLAVEIARGVPTRRRPSVATPRSAAAVVPPSPRGCGSSTRSSAEEASLRERAVQVVYAVDPDRARVGTVLEGAANDPDAGVRSAAAEFKRYMPGVVFDDDAGG